MIPSGAVGLESPAKHVFGCICVCVHLCGLKLPTFYIPLLICATIVYLSSSGSMNGTQNTHTRSSIKKKKHRLAAKVACSGHSLYVVAHKFSSVPPWGPCLSLGVFIDVVVHFYVT